MRFYSFLLLIVSLSYSVYAGKIETVVTHSDAMNKDIKAVVLTPDDYSEAKEYAVVYLLHGHSGNQDDWSNQVEELGDYADEHDIIIVCPDGNYNSWYFDSPEKPESKYETYVAKELVTWVDANYSTIKSREGRAITGLSMGGHGGLYLGIRNQDVFAQAGSMSGGVDLVPFPGNWQIAEYLGSYADYPDRWESNSIVNMTHLIKRDSLKLIIECGTGDFFYAANVKLHDKLEYENIPHTFISSPGGHTWDFWRNAIKYQLQYFTANF